MTDDPGQDRNLEGLEEDRDPVEDLAEAPWTDWRAVAARLVPYLGDLQPVELQPWRPAGGQETGEAGDEEIAGDTAGEDGGG